MSATILYGLANCSSCKEAREWLDAEGISYDFHDLRKQGLGEERLDRWLKELGWEVLLNRRGTTWRSLPDANRIGLDAAKARRLMLSYPSLIKRPVLEVGAAIVVGFSRSKYDVVFEGAD
jgi:arsenate reductase